MSQDKKDHRLSVYDNVPAPQTIDKKILDRVNNYDEDEDIRRRIHTLRRNQVYDNVATDATKNTIDRRMLDQFNNCADDEDRRRRGHTLRPNKVTHHYKKCFCKIENAFLRFGLINLTKE